MARYEYNPGGGYTAGARYRIDTASGSTTPATIEYLYTPGHAIEDSILRAGPDGWLPGFAAGTDSLYAKRLNSAGGVVGAPVALVGVELGVGAAAGSGGGAAGSTGTLWIPAADMSVTTGSPTLAIPGTGSRWPCYDFDASANGQITLTTYIPSNWEHWWAELYWVNRGTSAGDVQWRATRSTLDEGANMATGDVVEPVAIVAADSQNVLKRTRVVIGAARSEGISHVRILRMADQAGDTLPAPAGVIGVVLGKS